MGSATVTPQTSAQLIAIARKRRQQRLIPVARIAILVVVLGAWEWGSRIHLGDNPKPIIDPFLWSRPSRIAERILEWLRDGTIFNNVFVTLLEAAMGFLIGTLFGVAIGFLLALSDFWARVMHPFIVALNSIPALVFAPIFFVIFGLGVESKIAIGALVVFFLTFWNAFQGVREVNRDVYRNAQTLGANRPQMAWHVLLPSALSWILLVGFLLPLRSTLTALALGVVLVLIAPNIGQAQFGVTRVQGFAIVLMVGARSLAPRRAGYSFRSSSFGTEPIVVTIGRSPYSPLSYLRASP